MSHWDLKMFPWSNQPRFYPPGAHPAAAQWREQLRKLNEIRLLTFDTPEILEAVAYFEQKLMEFEQGEVDAKVRAYAKSGQEHPSS